jgi:cellulose synthase/poly-beta-1,6-N-acetylglucosamine synthase-like glycosyltransferase
MTLIGFAQIIFWLSVSGLFYAYIGYAAVVFILSRFRSKSIIRSDIEPTVTIIITAFNEEKNLRSKIENTLLLDYPAEKLEIIIASDGSTDATDEIAGQYADRNVRLFRQEGRAGKTTTQNGAVEQATGEILLFSDATTIYSPDVLRKLLPNFSDETVGCVAGKLIYVDETDSNVGTGATHYWNYETLLKESESRVCSLIGVSGCMYAVRRSAYVPMYAEACSDFLICTVLYRQGLRSVYESTAICTEQTNSRAGNEFDMRVRVISQTFTDLWRNRDMLNPLKSGFYGLQLFSHKVLRYAAPGFLLLTLVTSAFLAIDSVFFRALLGLEIAFYLMALGAWILESRNVRTGIFAALFYFVLANVSAALAFYKFLRGDRYASWEPLR